MIWIILFFASGFGIWYAKHRRWFYDLAHSDDFGFGQVIALVSIVTCLLMSVVVLDRVINAIGVYPHLVAQRVEVETLVEMVSDVRDARYDVAGGSLIGGALDNLQQSSTLSEYIKSYAAKRAVFNSRLAGHQTRKQMWVYNIIAFYMFVDSRVMEINPV